MACISESSVSPSLARGAVDTTTDFQIRETSDHHSLWVSQHPFCLNIEFLASMFFVATRDFPSKSMTSSLASRGDHHAPRPLVLVQGFRFARIETAVSFLVSLPPKPLTQGKTTGKPQALFDANFSVISFHALSSSPCAHRPMVR